MDIRVGAEASNTASGNNTAAIVTLSAPPEGRLAMAYISWSYSDTPTAGRLTIASGGVTFFDVDITGKGVGALRPVPLPGGVASTIVVTLAAGGGGIIGKLNAYAGRH